MNPADPINPQWVFWELSPRLPDRCIITADSGSSADWFARDLKIREGMMASLSGNLATMGPRRAVRHRRQVRASRPGGDRLRGRRRDADERHQRADHHREVLDALADPRLIVLVLNNRDLNQVTWEQRVFEGDPKFEASQDVPGLPLRRVRRSAGPRRASGWTGPEQVGAAWDQALRGRPAVRAGGVSPIPTCRRCRRTSRSSRPGAFASSMVKGDPDAGGVIRQSFRDLVESYLPHKGVRVAVRIEFPYPGYEPIAPVDVPDTNLVGVSARVPFARSTKRRAPGRLRAPDRHAGAARMVVRRGSGPDPDRRCHPAHPDGPGAALRARRARRGRRAEDARSSSCRPPAPTGR